ncbi:prohead core protein [Caulobacter phage Cr30]|uniref:prohead core protein n=1 Tax=Caulobacter phage Cr30 TaxID=1357714 RepID=UPI0004A9B9B1|nr:prohead core protein [Caulobacter phage Cr30]AGS81066.1 prohead core protein [Caulobacter phage Cr30]
MVKKTEKIDEVYGSDGQSDIPTPIDKNGHDKRDLDQDNGQKSQAIQAAVAQLIQYSAAEISDFTKGLDKSKNKRPLDQDNGQSAATLAKEDLETLFSGTELSEEVQETLKTIFEASVNARLMVEKVALEESFEAKLTEAVLEIRQELTEAVDKYITEAAETWLQENEVPLESALKVQIAENMITSVRDLVIENSFTLPENVEVVEDLTNRNADLQEQLAAAQEQIATLSESVLENAVSETFNELTEGLALTQIERLRELAEGIEYKTPEEFTKKFSVVLEAFSDKKKTPPVITEEVVEINENEAINESVNAYVGHMKKRKSS